MAEYPPCLNPSCKSHGHSHPNCMCYAQQADGGLIEHFCSKDQMHNAECEYYAEGGSIKEDEDDEYVDPSDAAAQQLKDALSFADGGEVSIPIEQFQPAQDAQSGNISPEQDSIPVEQFVSHEQKYGTPLEMAKTAGEGLAKGVAGPLADLALNKLGSNPKEREERAQENPLTHYGSEAVGLIAPALATKGGSLASQAGVIGRIAKVVAGGEGAANVAARMGLESALFTLGDETSKAINGNPDSIQSAAMHVGLSSILGAGVGLPFGKMGDLWTSKLGPKADQVVYDFSNALKGFSNEIPGEAASSIGNKAAKLIMNKASKAASDALATGAGSALGKLSGVPGGGWMGGIFGHYAVKPLISTFMPSLLKPVLETAASGEGFATAMNAINAVAKGEVLAQKAAKALFEGGIGDVLTYPDKSDLERLDKRVGELGDNPHDMLDIGGSIGHYLPNHETALAATAQNAVNYLNAQKPRDIQPGPLSRNITPNQQQVDAYNRTLSIAEQPLVVLRRMANGSLTPKDVQDLKTLYPALYPSLSQKINNNMIEHLAKGNNVPYRLRAAMSTFMGQPMDSTFSQPARLAIQATYLPAPGPQNAPGGAPKKKGTAKLGKTAKMAQTPSEARQEALLKA